MDANVNDEKYSDQVIQNEKLKFVAGGQGIPGEMCPVCHQERAYPTHVSINDNGPNKLQMTCFNCDNRWYIDVDYELSIRDFSS